MPKKREDYDRTLEPYLILVEGQDEYNLIDKMIKSLNLNNGKKYSIKVVEGKNNFKPYLKALPKFDGFENIVVSIGIIRDADDNPDGAFDSIKSALKAAILPVPRKVSTPSVESPRITVLILPGGDKTGELEDICLESVKDDPAMQCVAQYFDCLENNCYETKVLPRPKKYSRASLYAFLSSRQETDARLGIAAQNGYIPFDHEAFDGIKKLIELVFEVPIPNN